MRFLKNFGSIVHESACVGVSGVRLQKDNCFKKEQPSGSGYIYVQGVWGHMWV